MAAEGHVGVNACAILNVIWAEPNQLLERLIVSISVVQFLRRQSDGG